MKTIEIKETITIFLSASFQIFISFVNIAVLVLLMFGSLASILLLYQMFPDTALILYEPLLLVFNVMFMLIKITGTLVLLFLLLYFIISIVDIFEDAKKDNELKRRKFMNEIVSKLKSEMKKK